MTEETKKGGLFDTLSSIGKGIGNVIFEADAEAETTPPASQPTSPANGKTIPNAGSVAPPTLTSACDPERVNEVRVRVLARQTPYVAFLAALDPLQDVIPDETMRIKAAFVAVTKGAGRNPVDLVRAIDLHLADARDELNRFETDAKSHYDATVGKRNQRITSLQGANEKATATVSELQRQIGELQQTIATNSREMDSLATEVAGEETKFNTTKQAFGNAIGIVTGELNVRKVVLAALVNA